MGVGAQGPWPHQGLEGAPTDRGLQELLWLKPWYLGTIFPRWCQILGGGGQNHIPALLSKYWRGGAPLDPPVPTPMILCCTRSYFKLGREPVKESKCLHSTAHNYKQLNEDNLDYRLITLRFLSLSRQLKTLQHLHMFMNGPLLTTLQMILCVTMSLKSKWRELHLVESLR